jgi:hypothetical protein
MKNMRVLIINSQVRTKELNKIQTLSNCNKKLVIKNIKLIGPIN